MRRRARVRLDAVEGEELARERRRARRPEQLHDLDELVPVGATAFVRHLRDHVVLDLERADADTDVEAATTQVIDGGQRLGGGHRVQVGTTSTLVPSRAVVVAEAKAASVTSGS